MALDRLFITLKIGDQTSPSGIKDGMIVDYYDEIETGILAETNFSTNHLSIFAVIEVPRELKQNIIDGLHPVMDADDNGKVKFARSMVFTVKDLEKITKKTGLEADLRMKGKKVDIIDGKAIKESDFKKSGDIDWVYVEDINSIASGSYTVGTAGDYATFAAAFADIANLTGNLTLTQISDITETAQSVTSNLIGAHTLKLTSNSSHNGDPTAGWVINHNFDGNMLSFGGADTGNVVIEKLRTNTLFALTAAFSSFAFLAANNNNTVVNNILFDGNGKGGRGLSHFGDVSANFEAWNLAAWNFSIGIRMTRNTPYRLENCTVYSCSGAGIELNSGTDQTIKNVASYDNGTDFSNHENATGNNNASSDATAGDGNWNSGSGNIINKTAAASFVSVVDTSSDFLDINPSGDLVEAGNLALLAENTAGIRLRLRPNALTTASIGAAEFAAIAVMPTITPNGGLFDTTQQVVLASATSGASIYYTENGDDPTIADTLYAAPFPITITEMIKAFAVKVGFIDSPVASAIFSEVSIDTFVNANGMQNIIDEVSGEPSWSQNLALTDNNNGSISLSWATATANVSTYPGPSVHYEVYARQGATPEFTSTYRICRVVGTSLTVWGYSDGTAFTDGQTIYFTVKAVDDLQTGNGTLSTQSLTISIDQATDIATIAQALTDLDTKVTTIDNTTKTIKSRRIPDYHEELQNLKSDIRRIR